MPTPKPKCLTLRPWLRSNLGKRCLAPLTGTDSRCLDAAVMILEAYAFNRGHQMAAAFGLVVQQMQEKCQLLAYHAIAHCMEWSDRDPVWRMAGLRPLVNVPRCSFEPGGPMTDLSKIA